MKFAKASGTICLVALTMIASSIAIAADTGWYLGGNVGQARAKIDNDKITNNLLGAGFTSVIIDEDDRDVGFKVFGGYQFNKNFAMEGGYFNLGQFAYSARTIPTGTLNGSLKIEGLNVDLVGILPITPKFSAFGRAGVNLAAVDGSFNGSGAVGVGNTNRSQSDLNYKFGLGVQYALNNALSIRVEAERYRINDPVGNTGDIDLGSVGLVYRFGSETVMPVQRAAAPVYVAPVYVVAAPPQPVVAPAPAAPVPVAAALTRRKITFTSDSFFGFDATALTPKSKQTLDTFSADLVGTEYSVITITGHTDRIGSHEYNQDLSTRRAEAVKSYLVETSKIPAEKIVATGVEETSPVTLPNECDDEKTRKDLIICLQPDRRVEVEVDATKITL